MQIRDGKQPEKKFLARRRVNSDGQRVDPGKPCAHDVFVVQVLRRPRAQLSADDIEDGDVSDVRGSHADADYVSAKEFLRSEPRQPQSPIEPDFVWLRHA